MTTVYSFWGSQDHRPAHVDMFTLLSSNKLCSTVTHVVNHKTCSVTTHAQSQVSSSGSRVAAKVELEFLPKGNTEKLI